MQSAEDILTQIRFAYVGAYPIAGMAEPWLPKMTQTLSLLRQAGIGVIVTLTEESPYSRHYREAGFHHLHSPIDDTRAPSPEQMDHILAFIDGHMDAGRAAAVHCLEGRGRTGTVLAAWLGRREPGSAEQVIRTLRLLRPVTVITPEQKRFLQGYLA